MAITTSFTQSRQNACDALRHIWISQVAENTLASEPCLSSVAGSMLGKTERAATQRSASISRGSRNGYFRRLNPCRAARLS